MVYFFLRYAIPLLFFTTVQSVKNSRLFFYIVFVYILVFTVLLPVIGQFFAERQTEIAVHYPFSVFFSAITAFFIYQISIRGFLFKKTIEHKKQPFFIYSSNALVFFGILCLSSVIFETLANFFTPDSGIHAVILPETFSGWMNFIFGCMSAAFSEEIIYRFYLPLAFEEIFSKRNNTTKSLRLIYEGVALILFAGGHIYLGIAGFLNALICGIALRMCMIRTKTVIVPFAIHALYNFLSLIVFAF